MAELDEKLLKTLDQTLQNMNTHLQNLESTLRGVKGGIDATFNPAIIKSFSDEIRGLKAARIIEADKSVAEVNKIYSKIQDLSYMVKTGMKLEPMSLKQLEEYRQRLEEIEALLAPMTGKKLKGQEWFDRRSLQRERDQIRSILDSESPVIPVPLKKEEIVAAVEELKKYKELYNSITKGEQQRAVELANIQQKEKNDLLKQEQQLNKEIAAEERQRNAEAQQRYKEAQAANKAQTQAQDDLEKIQRQARVAESKAAYTEDTKKRIQQAKEAAAIQKKADAESMANQRRQIQIKSQLAAIDKNRISITKQSSDREKALAAQQQADYRSLQSELSKLIARQKELNAVSQGSGRRAKDRLSTYTISESEKAMRRYADAVRNAHRVQKKLGDETNKMLPTLQRLASAFGIAFSVRGLAQFGKKLIETRGEFEMQFVAMKQIIGDVDAATKIWNQTMQQALQSPFKAMQLVTYTKQLAAYRIETEKLFDTTKRLADISAGLGVDMGRLILAYGQVKSANFLRASEVRQFTEAGVNIVGNLAQYFTELEGRAVSTADVMERITKRMVMFSDVEEIFRRMTDEGGEFYKMQEVQADTVKGQIAKLHDAYDQMLNTIGQANQGVLRDYIEKLNDLVRNWRTVASFIMKNVNALVILVPLITAYKRGAKQAAGATFTWKEAMEYIGASFKKGSIGLKKFTLDEALGTAATYAFAGAIEIAKMALRTFVPLLVIEGLIWLITKMGEADRNAKELAKSLDEVGSKNASSLQENIDGFTDLYERLKQANEGSQEYLDIRNKIQSQYGEYLDNLSAEQITVENLANAYDRVVDRMREKSRQHIMEEGLQEITKSYGESLQKFSKVIQKELGFEKEGEAENFAKKMYEMYAKSGGAFRQGGSLFTAAYKEYFNTDKVPTLNIPNSLQRWFDAIELRYTKQNDLMVKANALTRAAADSHEQYNRQLEIEAEHEQRIADIRKDPSVQSAGRRNLLMQAEEIRYAEEKLELQKQVEEEALAARAKEKKLNEEEIEEERKIIQKKYDDSKKNLQVSYGAFLDAYNEQVKNFVQERFKERLEGKDFMSADNKDAWAVYDMMVAKKDKISQGQTRWYNSILESKKLTEEEIERIKAQQATQTAADSEAAKALNESLKQEEDRLELIKKQMELLGLHEKQKGGSGSANNSIYGERIRLLQDMLQKYKQLAKEAYGYAKAEGKVSESFEDAWNSIMPAGYGDLEVPTSYKALAEMLQRLEAFTPAFDKNGQLSKMLADLKKAVADALSQVDIEMSVRIREDFGKKMEEMFSNYDLTLDLEKLSLPTDELEGIFKFDHTTLDELRKAVDDFYNQQIALGDDPTELVKQVEGYYKKIDEMEKKELRERLKTYTKYLEEGQNEALKIHLEELKKMAELDELYQKGYYTDTQYKDISKAIKKETDEKLAKNDWQQFKETDFYITMFEDLSKVSSESIDIMIKRLKALRKNIGDLDPKQAKEIVKTLEKLEKVKLERSPLKSFFADWKTAREWRKTSDDLAKKMGFYGNSVDYYTKEQERQSSVVANLRNEYEQLVQNGRLEDAAEVKKRLDFEEEELSNINENLDDRTDKLNEANEAYNKGYAAQKRVYEGVAQGAQYFSDLASTAGTISTEIMDMFDGVSDASKKLAKDIAEIATNTGMLAADIAKAIASKGIDVSAMIDGLARTFNIVRSTFSAVEAEINRTVENETDKIEELEWTLDRLRRARDRAWDTAIIVQKEKEIEKAINDQIAAYDSLIAAEEERKNKDEDLITQWTQEREELFETLQDEREEILQTFGGIGEGGYRDAAQGFVDAWKSAFLETGDGLQGLQDHFDEFLNDWFVKQATMRIAGKTLEPLFRDIDAAVDKYEDGGTDVMMSELKKVFDRADLVLPDLSDKLAELAGQFNLGGEGSLSGLAAGIQGMTEEQANILESYWNSVRGYTASIDMNVARIAEALGASGVNTNPQLQQLNLIAANTQATHQLLQSVTKSGHSQGGYGIKVFAD